MSEAVTADMIRQLIVGHDASRPRSKQHAIGPSDLSASCNRRLMYQILNVDRVVPNKVNLAAWIGTQLHRGMELAAKGNDDWATEIRLSVNVAKGITLTGTADAYHKPSFTLLDYKSAGPSAMQKYRREMPDNYETQVDVYALMAVLSGKFRVDNVGIVLLPRNGTLEDIHVYTRPWNSDRADAAIKRLVDLHAAAALGTAALPLMATADACMFCGWHMPGWIGDIAEACPGHQTTATTPLEVTTQPSHTRGTTQ